MRFSDVLHFRSFRSCALLCALVVLAASAFSQTFDMPAAGFPQDWSHHHLVFSNPGTYEQAVRNGTVAKWRKITSDPRYIIQQRAQSRTSDASPVEVSSSSAPKKRKLKKDWTTTLGGVPASLTGTIGTLSSSTISGSSTLAVDGVTFDASAPTPEKGTLTEGGSAPGTTTLVVGAISYNFSSSSLGTSPAANTCNVYTNSSRSTTFTDLTNALNNTGTASTSTYECHSGATPNGTITAVLTSNGGSGGHVITLTAVTLGSTGFTAPTVGTTGITWAVTASGTDGTTSGTSSPPTFAYWSGATYVSPAQVASNIATAINNNTTLQTVSTGVSATANSPASGDVTITARTVGTGGNTYAVTPASFSAFTPSGDLSGGESAAVQPNAYPAKFSFSTSTASCSDFAVYPTGMAGATGAANIIAFDNLYAAPTCSTGTVPSANWAYNTGGTVTTSPILSLDGSQVAFMQVSGTTASLVLLKWAASTTESIIAPDTLTAQASAAAYRNCTAPCYYALSLGANDTLSAPFYDYLRDALYVGDDSGNLHQFFGVFDGSPAENTASPWPVHLGANKLSSPVYDSEQGFQAGYIFVGDMGGVFYSVGSGYGGTTSGNIHGNTGSLGDAIADAPLVDSLQGVEYVFVTTNGSYSWQGYNAVWEFVSIFTNRGTPGVVPVGVGGTGYYLYAGTFDNVYFQSSPPSYAATGNLYVVGNTGTAGGATLYQVPISFSALTGASNPVVTGLNATEHAWPSPVSEFCNNGTSVCALQTASGCTVTANSPTITCSGGGLTTADVGATITGTDIPPGATITGRSSSTSITISPTPTVGTSGVTLTIGVTTSGTDYVFFSVNRGAKTGCTNAAGNGCILSYNISNPSSVSQAGGGLNVTTPGTNGCWATGGIVIDNSSTASGASQIYFVNLNGNTAGGPTGATSGNCTAGSPANISAVQAAQANP